MHLLRKVSSDSPWLPGLLVFSVLCGCAEVTRPTPSALEVEECQLAAVKRHPFKSWSWERASRVFLRELAVLPQVHGRTYPFLGFNWWVTEGERVVIDNVWEPSPAHDAGLKQGDILLAVHNWPLHPWVRDWDEKTRVAHEVFRSAFWTAPRPQYGEKNAERLRLLTLPGEVLVALMLDLKYIRMESRERYLCGPVELLVQRDGEKFSVTLFPQHLPAEYAILVDSHDRTINAYAAPGRVILTRRLLSFCINDDELALVVGHELAHQALGHLVRGAGHRRLGGLAGKLWQLTGVVATQSLYNLMHLRRAVWQEERSPGVVADAVVSAFSREDEREADIYGLWYAFQAGYNLERGLAVWERLGAVLHDPFEATYFLSHHPAPMERLARLKKVASLFKAGKAAEVLLQAPSLEHRPPPL